MQMPEVPVGCFLVIRTNGEETLHQERPSIANINRAINCDCADTVILTRDGREPELVMMVDDTGMIDGRPVNAKATQFYHSVCRPGTTYSIHGDVAIVHDGDFA